MWPSHWEGFFMYLKDFDAVGDTRPSVKAVLYFSIVYDFFARSAKKPHTEKISKYICAGKDAAL